MRLFSSASDPIAANGGPRIHALSVVSAKQGALVRIARNGSFEPIYPGEIIESAEGFDWLEAAPNSEPFVLRVFQAPLSVARPTSSSTLEGGGIAQIAEVLHAAATNPIDIAAGTVVQVLDDNAARKTLTLQNGSLAKLYWSLNPGLLASGANANGVLAAASATDAGDGGFLSLPGWLGPVYVAASADGGSRVRVAAY